MTIERIDQQTVKIILTSIDMDGFELTYEQIDYNCPDTRRVILKLLQQIKNETQIDLTKGRLFIEAFPYDKGGCVLYINIIGEPEVKRPRKTGFNTPLIFSFDDIDLLSDVCRNLFQNYSHLILKSSLYTIDQKYILMVYSYFKLDEKIVAIMSEFGEYLGKGAFKGALFAEHAKPLIENQAVETVVEYLI